MAGVLLGEQNLLIDNNTSNWLQMDNIFSSKYSAMVTLLWFYSRWYICKQCYDEPYW